MAFQFRVDPRNGAGGDASPCAASCCCRQADAVPGETNAWTINYQPWVAPLGGRGLANPTEIVITKITPGAAPPAQGAPPVAGDELLVDAQGTVIGDIPAASGGVLPAAGPQSADGVVTIPQNRIAIRGSVLTFALVVAPTATVGDLYRLTIRQAALDCGAAFFFHVSCYDIEIVRC